MDVSSVLDVINVENIDENIEIHHALRDRSNPLEDFTEQEFQTRFRFSKKNTISLLQLIEADLSFSSKRNNFVPPILQLATALRFYATGNFQKTDGDLIGIDQSSTCRIVSQSIAKRKQVFINFPTGLSLSEVKRQFHEIARFPNVIGCIDGTHIPISSPGGEQAELYGNRKGYFSINVQAVCDATLCFTNIVCRWPGSTHDSRVFSNSALCCQLEDGSIDGIILGDSGYPCKKFLMTPLLDPRTSSERRYNFAHISTRSTVERMFGVWKQRFRCLRTPIRTKMQNTLTIVVATACLHNYAMRRGEVVNIDASDETNSNDIDAGAGGNNENPAADEPTNIAGTAMRRQIITQNF